MPFKLACFCNPYIVAAVAAVAIGVVIYEVLSAEKPRHSYERRRPPPPPSPPSPPPSPKPKKRPSKPKRPPSKPKKPESSDYDADSSTLSESKDSIDTNIRNTENTVRRRIPNGPRKEELNEIGSEKKEQPVLIASPNLNCQNINQNSYEKNVCEKILNDITSANTETRINDNLNKNIPNEDSDSENNAPETENNSLRNRDVLNHSVPSSDGNNLPLSREKEEEMYKREVHDTLMRENVESQEPVVTPEASSHVQHYEQNERINANITLGVCSGCEENPINAAAYPCGHCYLCIDCFEKVFRIGYKKCSICYAEIKYFGAI